MSLLNPKTVVLTLATFAALAGACSAPIAPVEGEQNGEAPEPPNNRKKTFNAMGPLVIGDWRNEAFPNENDAEGAWANFDEQLKKAKELGVQAISTDVWWGIVEKERGVFNWAYYEKIAQKIKAAGLRWIPIMSLHSCGGNIGDECDIPVPEWVWTYGLTDDDREKYGTHKYQYLGERSLNKQFSTFNQEEQEKAYSKEFISAWSTDNFVPVFSQFFEEFQKTFHKEYEKIIDEINVSTGPAGECRYPSYNKHDFQTNTIPWGDDSNELPVVDAYPSRGTLQAYSITARKSFLEYVTALPGIRGATDEETIKNLLERWPSPGAVIEKFSQRGLEAIEPPTDVNIANTNKDGFFTTSYAIAGAYGHDFFDWYSQSLLQHCKKITTAALKVFDGENAPFRSIPIGEKVAGIHWRTGDNRYAELTAGLIRSSDFNLWQTAANGHGYAPILGMFKDVSEKHKDEFSSYKDERLDSCNGEERPSHINVHFTCIEMNNWNDNNVGAGSRAKDLVEWVGDYAHKIGLPLKGENAIASNIAHRDDDFLTTSWGNIEESIKKGYGGITILRLSDLFYDERAGNHFNELVRAYSEKPENWVAERPKPLNRLPQRSICFELFTATTSTQDRTIFLDN